MGVRISRHGVGVGAADDRRRTPVRRQPERHRLLARRAARLHRVDVRGEGRRPRLDFDRPPRRHRARARATPHFSPISKGNVYARRCGERRVCCGRARSTSIRSFGSPARRCWPAIASTCRPRRTKKADARPATPAARFAAASSRSTRAPGEVVWKSYTIAERAASAARLRRRHGAARARRAARSGRRRRSTSSAARSTSGRATRTAARCSRPPTQSSRSISKTGAHALGASARHHDA